LNILFLCHRIPYPPNKGDKIRSFNEIKYLSRHHNIALGTTLDDESETMFCGELSKYCSDIYCANFNRKINRLKSLITGKPFSVSNFYDKSLQSFVDEALATEKIDTVICYCSSMAEYIFRSRLFKSNQCRSINLVMDFVDLDSDKWRQYSGYSHWFKSLIFRMENKRLLKFEKKINQYFNHSVFVARRELEVFQKLYKGARNLHTVQNGVDLELFQAHPKSLHKSPIIVFTGFMDYFANEDGVIWFCREILPRIQNEFPQVQFYIVGKNPTNKVWTLSELDGVTVTGYVEDIREYYWMADICVIPLRIARGLQNKVIEAMATGNAVVATSNASDGIVCNNGKDIVIADKAEHFSAEVLRLLKNPAERETMGQMAIENVKKHYSWAKNLQFLEDIL
jgi:sugar transferase (PEP-CTERM/EpsH1 system associated)